MKKFQDLLNYKKMAAMAAVGLVAIAIAAPASADFVAFEIRKSSSGGIAPGIIDLGAGNIEFIIDAGGQKAALGSNDINGQTLGSIANLHIDRSDDRTRFTAGSGPYVAPYLNFWITDGTNYAVVANEPSNPAFQSLYDNGYNLSFADLSNKVAKIYENSNKAWLPNLGVNLTFADLADFIIQAPTVAELTAGWTGLGTGAPRELGTNVAYGVNWVFGDTLSNYVSGDDGYIVANASVSVSAVPIPAAAFMFAPALLGFLGLRRKAKLAQV